MMESIIADGFDGPGDWAGADNMATKKSVIII